MGRVKIKERERAQVLRRQGRSLNEISQLLSVSKSSASLWLRSLRLKEIAVRRLSQRIIAGSARGRKVALQKWQEYRREHPKPAPNLNRLRISTFFNNWTPEMAYVLGYFAADGCMYRSRNGGFYNGGLYFEFTSTDKELLEIVRELMGILNKIELAQPWNGDQLAWKRKTRYKLRIVNAKAYKRLLELGFTPAKSLTLQFPDVPDGVLNHFFRGYFDGDGCVHFARYERRGSRKVSYRYVFSVKFTCGSRDFLASLQQSLMKIAKVGHGSLHPHGPNWELSYAARDSRQLYKFMYPTSTVPCLIRKRKKFEQGMALGPMV